MVDLMAACGFGKEKKVVNLVQLAIFLLFWLDLGNMGLHETFDSK